MAESETLTKPVPITKSAIDYSEAAKWIGQKLGYDLRDTLNSDSHYGDWCRKYGEEVKSDSKEQYARYTAADDGDKARPDYRDYWHFLIDHCAVSNGGIITIGLWLLDDRSRCQRWQIIITKEFISEFGDNCEYWTDW